MARGTKHYTSPALYLKARGILHPKPFAVAQQVIQTRSYLKTVGNEGATDYIVLPTGQIVEMTEDGLFYWNTQAAPVSAELRRVLWFLRQDRSRLLRQGMIYVEYIPGKPLSLQLSAAALPYLTDALRNILGLARRLNVSTFDVHLVRRWQGREPQGPRIVADGLRLRDWFRRVGAIFY